MRPRDVFHDGPCTDRYASRVTDGRTRYLDRPKARRTAQQAAVHSALSRCGGFVSAQALHHRMRGEGHATGLTTVYRHLQRLAHAGDADVVMSATDGALYRICSSDGHHHHLVCRGCGLAVEIEGPEVEAWADETGRRHAFTDLDHRIEIFGLCRECAETDSAPR